MKKQNNDTEKTKIYLVENCYGDSNKIYIGKTTKSRKTKHKIKFGKQIEYTYIDEVLSLNKKDWKPLEGFWIQYFKFLGFEVLNKNIYGGGGPSFYNEEQKNKMKKPKNHGYKLSKALKGRKCFWIKKGKKGRTKSPILQFDKHGNFIKQWLSQKQASSELCLDTRTLTACLKGRQKTCGGYKWVYLYPQNNLKFL